MENQINEQAAAYIGASAISLFKGAGIFLVFEVVILMLLGSHSSFGIGISIYSMALFLVVFPYYKVVQFGYHKLCDYSLDSREDVLRIIFVIGCVIETILMIISVIMHFV